MNSFRKRLRVRLGPNRVFSSNDDIDVESPKVKSTSNRTAAYDWPNNFIKVLSNIVNPFLIIPVLNRCCYFRITERYDRKRFQVLRHIQNLGNRVHFSLNRRDAHPNRSQVEFNSFKQNILTAHLGIVGIAKIRSPITS